MSKVVDRFADKFSSHPKKSGKMWAGTNNLEESLNYIVNAFS